MLKKYRNLAALFLLLAVLSCQNRKAEPTSEYSLSDQVPSDFIDFLERFHSDSLYQIEHIVFPLAGEENKFGESSNWNKENWQMHKGFDSSLSDFSRQFINMNDLITEFIQDKYGLFSSERRFTKMSDEWHLIYYNVVYRKMESEEEAKDTME